jgi:hypothetical protein
MIFEVGKCSKKKLISSQIFKAFFEVIISSRFFSNNLSVQKNALKFWPNSKVFRGFLNTENFVVPLVNGS